MKYRIFTSLLTGIVLILALTNSCQKDDIEIIKEKITGSVQKGPFINGSTILMSELNSSLQQTGKIFTTQIINNRGSFEIANISLSSSFVEFSANGFYYDEVRGVISSSPLNLYALSDITDISTINVNILTHLEKRRVEYLINNEESFAEAKERSQREIITIFGIEKTEMQNSETLDISVDNDDNAILLAISLILQGNRRVGDLSELLASFSNDIYLDGRLDDPIIMADLRSSTMQLNLQNIRENLVSRYESLGISATIPNFEKYITNFLWFTSSQWEKDHSRIKVMIVDGGDDVEECQQYKNQEEPAGYMNITSNDLELGNINEGSQQIVGLIFRNVAIPVGVTITNAYIQFTADGTNEEVITLDIWGGLVANITAPWGDVLFTISSTPKTTALVKWTPPEWAVKGERGADQQTPDISTIIQEIIGMPGWAAGNNLSIMFMDKSGTAKQHREAESFEDTDGSRAAELVVIFTESQ